MNTYTIPISQARTKLPKIVQDAWSLSRKTYITVNGSVQAAIVNAQELESMESTLEVLNDSAAMKAIKAGIIDTQNESLVDWQDIKTEFNL